MSKPELPQTRCAWAQTDPLMRRYHDEEWGVPNYDSRSLWEQLMLEGFQAGLAWIVVLRKREAFRTAFRNFDPEMVAALGEADITDMLGNPGIVRSKAKIEATIGGARAYLRLRDQGTDFADWAWSFVDGQPLMNTGPVPVTSPLALTLSKELKGKGFKFVGPVIVYAWMQAIGLVNDHAPDCFRRHATTPPHGTR